MMQLKGVTGILEVYDDHISIKREGFVAKATHVNKRENIQISYQDISHVKFKKGILNVSGYIYFATEDHHSCSLFEAATNEQAVVFRSYLNEEAERIYKEILQHLSKNRVFRT